MAGKSYHATCFICGECEAPIIDKFYTLEDGRWVVLVMMMMMMMVVVVLLGMVMIMRVVLVLVMMMIVLVSDL